VKSAANYFTPNSCKRKSAPKDFCIPPQHVAFASEHLHDKPTYRKQGMSYKIVITFRQFGQPFHQANGLIEIGHL
jgi:hypothetical protein